MKKLLLIIPVGLVAIIAISTISGGLVTPAETTAALNCKSVSGWLWLVNPGAAAAAWAACKTGSIIADILPEPEPAAVKYQEGKEIEVFAPDLPNVPGAPDPTEGIPQLVAFVYAFALWIVGLAVFVQITAAGVQWLVAAGNPGQISAAKSKMTNALFGLVLLLGSYVILNTINPDLVNTAFQLPKLVGITPGIEPGAADPAGYTIPGGTVP
jgi:hypothetical protein